MFGFIVFGIFAAFFVLILVVKDKATLAKLMTGFLVFFLGGLALAGISAMFTGILEATRGFMDARQLAVQLGAGLLLAATGAVPLYLFFVHGEVATRRLERRKARHPDAPWMWVSEWSRGSIRYSARGPVTFMWVVLLALAGGLSFVWYMNRSIILAELRESPVGVVAFYMVFASLLFLGFVAAVRLLRGYLAFGGSTFEVSGARGVVGGELAGVIHTGIRDVPEPGFEIRLRCTRRGAGTRGRTGIGDDGARLWQADAKVPPEQARVNSGRVRIPVRFEIPADAPESDAWSPDTRIEWTLSAASSAGGRAYYSEFVVPVFRAAPMQAQHQHLRHL